MDNSSDEAIMREMLAATVDMENVNRHLAEANRLITASPMWLAQIPNGLMGSLVNANNLLETLTNDRIYMEKMRPRSEQGVSGGDEQS